MMKAPIGPKKKDSPPYVGWGAVRGIEENRLLLDSGHITFNKNSRSAKAPEEESDLAKELSSKMGSASISTYRKMIEYAATVQPKALQALAQPALREEYKKLQREPLKLLAIAKQKSVEKKKEKKKKKKTAESSESSDSEEKSSEEAESSEEDAEEEAEEEEEGEENDFDKIIFPDSIQAVVEMEGGEGINLGSEDSAPAVDSSKESDYEEETYATKLVGDTRVISDDEGEDSEENRELAAVAKDQSSIQQKAAEEEFESLDLGADMSVPIIAPEGWIMCADYVNFDSS